MCMYLIYHIILYINSVSLFVNVSVCRGLETQITFNKTVPPNSRAQKLFRTSSSYFLLLLLRSFPHSNCRRSLLLTFTFTFVSAQQLPEVLTSYFYFYVRFRPATAGGLYFLLLLLRPFLRSNCRRSLLLTFTFTSVSAQQLPEVFTSYFYFYIRFRAATVGGPYFLLLLLRPFPRSNCRRRWGKYFWDLEGG